MRAVGNDGYSAVLDLRDALQGDVTIVDSLEGRPLDSLAVIASDSCPAIA